MPEYVTEESPNLSTLISGIVDDMQRLIRQEIALARREIKDELAKLRNGGVMLLAGLFFLWIVPVMLAFMFVKLLQLAIPTEWVCFAIVAATFLLIGGGLIMACVHELKRVNVVPPQTAETIRQDLKAIAHPGSSVAR